jgi:glycosyltransferase involved in cell wall biosynthesis
MRFLIKGPVDSMSGYGNDICGLATTLEDVGHEVHLMPLSLVPPIPERVARMLTVYPNPPFDVAIVHVAPMSMEATEIRQVCKTILGWTMWEYESYLIEPGKLRESLAAFDRLLVYDEVSQKALADPLVAGGVVPVSILQGGYDPTYWARANQNRRDWGDTFKFGMVGRLDRRKGPWTAIEAFVALKDEHGEEFDAELHLKTTLPGLPSTGLQDKGVYVHAEWWPHQRLREFYETLHCLLAPSTGEGKNVPALEAQTTGVPVIATAYAGHMQWLTSEWGYPLEAGRDTYGHGVAAKVDPKVLADQMWHVYTHRTEARRKGELAARVIPPMCSWTHVVDRLMDVIRETPQRDVSAWRDRRRAEIAS